MDRKYVRSRWIESRLALAVEKPLLCRVTPSGKGCPQVREFTGGGLPVDGILALRETDEAIRKDTRLEKTYAT